jgi:Cof subfamily protein (haloacid dehalogenase superfamily)
MPKIKLVVSDVDGTLVTGNKRLTEAALGAVRRLREAGIAFTVTSSRPPVGLRMLVEPLELTLPMGAFNGGSLVEPGGRVIEERLIAPNVARDAAVALAAADVGVWVFAGDHWLVLNGGGDYVDRERRTLQAEPLVVDAFGESLARASKIVGVSRDFDRLATCETALRAVLRQGASVARSQPYYLDVTPPGVDKGTMVDAMGRLMGLGPEAIATIGDMENDVPMFARSGLAIAMGNAGLAVKARAHAVTTSNEEDGFAYAMEHLVLGATVS